MSKPLKFHSTVKTKLTSGCRYIHIMNGDSHQDEGTKSQCSEDLIGRFLLGIEEGGLLSCQGWSEELGYPLGTPQGPPVESTNAINRSFAYGTTVSYDKATREA